MPRIMQNVMFLLVENNRSRAYLQRCVSRGILPSYVVLLNSDSITPGQRASDKDLSGSWEESFQDEEGSFKLYYNVPLTATLQENSIPFLEVDSSNPNDSRIIKLLGSRGEDIVVPSLPGGVILSDEIMSTGKKFLHIHPGVVPYFKGSTTIYYSLLLNGTVGASAIFMSKEIDEGDVIQTGEFRPPKDRTTIDYYYDPVVRSSLLADVLESFDKGELEAVPQVSGEEAYYIIHPVLKHISILGTGGQCYKS